MTVSEQIFAPKDGRRRALMLIDGKWEKSASGQTIAVENPANRRTIGLVPRSGAEDVDRAVQAAAKGYPAWSRTNPGVRVEGNDRVGHGATINVGPRPSTLKPRGLLEHNEPLVPIIPFK
jgi:delta 1-pyrroline-5-carboxylate dehydrogenase